MKSKSRRSIPWANVKGDWVSPRFFFLFACFARAGFSVVSFQVIRYSNSV